VFTVAGSDPAMAKHKTAMKTMKYHQKYQGDGK